MEEKKERNKPLSYLLWGLGIFVFYFITSALLIAYSSKHGVKGIGGILGQIYLYPLYLLDWAFPITENIINILVEAMRNIIVSFAPFYLYSP
jgi:hypothetical protein